LQVPRTIHASDQSELAGKYPDNTTIVYMDKNGNYKVVYGLKLDQISKGDLKVLINYLLYFWIEHMKTCK
jgi:hypothetical protein